MSMKKLQCPPMRCFGFSAILHQPVPVSWDIDDADLLRLSKNRLPSSLIERIANEVLDDNVGRGDTIDELPDTRFRCANLPGHKLLLQNGGRNLSGLPETSG